MYVHSEIILLIVIDTPVQTSDLLRSLHITWQLYLIHSLNSIHFIHYISPGQARKYKLGIVSVACNVDSGVGDFPREKRLAKIINHFHFLFFFSKPTVRYCFDQNLTRASFPGLFQIISPVTHLTRVILAKFSNFPWTRARLYWKLSIPNVSER